MTSPANLLKAWNLRARKELGQNFLKDTAIAASIVDLAGVGPRDTVVEIGAGLGVMTVVLGRLARQVIAVEKDRALVPLLRAELLAQALPQVRIVEEDILKLDLVELAGGKPAHLIVLGNLPYNISSQVVVRLIRQRQVVRRAVLMFQKELAQRLCAGPGSKTYGRLSVLLQYCAEIKYLKDVGAGQFHPRPKVDSAVVGITFRPRIAPAADDEGLFARVVQAAFGQRRKTLRNALAGGFLPLKLQESAALLEASGIDPRRRAETLSVAEFVALSNRIGAHLKG
jgi:16S rRNA (adenine1518-N6/adenine1519-N6)-dimethyltransferase